jgi:hypothetical protein
MFCYYLFILADLVKKTIRCAPIAVRAPQWYAKAQRQHNVKPLSVAAPDALHWIFSQNFFLTNFKSLYIIINGNYQR